VCVIYVLSLVAQLANGMGALLAGISLHGETALSAGILLQVGPEEAICNMLDAIKGWTSILVIAAAIAIGFALILSGFAPEFVNWRSSWDRPTRRACGYSPMRTWVAAS